MTHFFGNEQPIEDDYIHEVKPDDSCPRCGSIDTAYQHEEYREDLHVGPVYICRECGLKFVDNYVDKLD